MRVHHVQEVGEGNFPTFVLHEGLELCDGGGHAQASHYHSQLIHCRDLTRSGENRRIGKPCIKSLPTLHTNRSTRGTRQCRSLWSILPAIVDIKISWWTGFSTMLKGVPTKPWVKDYRKRAGSRLTEVISLAASLSTCPECPPQVHNSHSLIHKQGYMRSGANVMHCNLLATYGRIFPQKIVTFFATSTLVCRHFWYWINGFNKLSWSVMYGTVGKSILDPPPQVKYLKDTSELGVLWSFSTKLRYLIWGHGGSPTCLN